MDGALAGGVVGHRGDADGSGVLCVGGSMKCSKCGHRANSIGAMAKHYRKKHPGAMKRAKRTMLKALEPKGKFGSKFCPHCGGFLG